MGKSEILSGWLDDNKMVVNDISKQGRHHKHVRLFLPLELRDKLMVNMPKGFLARLYAPQQQDPSQFVDQNEVNLTIVVNENEPDPQYRRHSDDLDSFLSNIQSIDSRIRILNDSVSKKDQPDLIDDWFIRNTVLLDHPGLDDRDDLRSKATDVKDVEVTESQLKHMETRYDEAKKEFIRVKLKSAKPTAKEHPTTKEKIFTIQQGEI